MVVGYGVGKVVVPVRGGRQVVCMRGAARIPTAIFLNITCWPWLAWPSPHLPLPPLAASSAVLPTATAAAAVNGSVRCLAMFVDEQGDEQIMAIAPALLPELLGIVARGQEYGAPLQRKALSILHTILEVLQVRGEGSPVPARWRASQGGEPVRVAGGSAHSLAGWWAVSRCWWAEVVQPPQRCVAVQ